MGGIIMLNIDWKERAIVRRTENKSLKKRIKELTSSRDSWRQKSTELKKENQALLTKLESIKKKLSQIDQI